MSILEFNSRELPQDTDPDVDPDGDDEFGSDLDDPWVRKTIRTKRRGERALRKKNRVSAKKRRAFARKLKLGLVEDTRLYSEQLREILREFYKVLGGTGVWLEAKGWDSTTDNFQFWHGILCQKEEPTRLLQLKLQDNGIVGNFTRDVSIYFPTYFKDLRVLSLSRNNLSSKKLSAKHLNSLTRLVVLNLEEVGLRGKIPVNLSLPNLENVNLRNNSLRGSCLPIFTCSSKLKSVLLAENKFAGQLSHNELLDAICAQSNLEVLDLSYNKFDGNVLPSKMCQNICKKLSVLRLSGNFFSSEITEKISLMTNLQDLHLDANGLHGIVPDGLYSLPKLRRVWLERTRLQGPLSKFTCMTNLRTLMLSDTHIYGEVPKSIAQLTQLQAFRCDNSRLRGIIPFDSFCALPRLIELSVEGNRQINPSSVKKLKTWALSNGIAWKRSE